MTETIQLTLAEVERRRKISEAMSGRSPWNKGKTGVYSDAVIQRLSEASRTENLSEETLRKHSEAVRGEKNPNYIDGRSSRKRPSLSEALRGRTLSVLHRRRIADALRGKNNPSWKGGVSFDPYCPRFNDKVKNRVRNEFGRTCVKCGKSAFQDRQRLSVHHIDDNKNQGCDGNKWRLIVLCNSCHGEMANAERHLLLFLLLLSNKRAELNMITKARIASHLVVLRESGL